MVTLYSTPTCYPCKAAEKQFAANGIDYNKIDLTEDADALASLKERRKSDIIHTPLFEVDGELHDITALRDIIDAHKV